MSKAMEIELSGGGVLPAYLAEPAEPARSAVVVIQEAFGLNAEVRRRCDRLAEEGYLALAPDLFWRVGPSIELDPDVEPELQRGLEILKGFDQDAAVSDLQAAVADLRRRLPAGGKVGAIGFCIGGKLAYLVAARTNVDAAIGYYGVGTEDVLDEASNIAGAFMLHVGTDDQFFKPAARDEVRNVFKDEPKLAFYSYENAAHGFASEFGKRRVEDAARTAEARSRDFFKRHLD